MECSGHVMQARLEGKDEEDADEIALPPIPLEDVRDLALASSRSTVRECGVTHIRQGRSMIMCSAFSACDCIPSMQRAGKGTVNIASHLGCKQQRIYRRIYVMRRRRLELRLHGQISDGLLWKLCKGNLVPPVNTLSTISLIEGRSRQLEPSPPHLKHIFKAICGDVMLQMCQDPPCGKHIGIGGSGRSAMQPSARFRGPTSLARLLSGVCPPLLTPSGEQDCKHLQMLLLSSLFLGSCYAMSFAGEFLQCKEGYLQ